MYISFGSSIFFSTIPVSVTYKGVVDGTNDYNIDVLVDAYKVKPSEIEGKKAIFRSSGGMTVTGQIVKVATEPLSAEEMRGILNSDFLSSSLIPSTYSFIVFMKPDADLSDFDLQIGDVQIIVDEVKPIKFLPH